MPVEGRHTPVEVGLLDGGQAVVIKVGLDCEPSAVDGSVEVAVPEQGDVEGADEGRHRRVVDGHLVGDDGRESALDERLGDDGEVIREIAGGPVARAENDEADAPLAERVGQLRAGDVGTLTGAFVEDEPTDAADHRAVTGKVKDVEVLRVDGINEGRPCNGVDNVERKPVAVVAPQGMFNAQAHALPIDSRLLILGVGVGEEDTDVRARIERRGAGTPMVLTTRTTERSAVDWPGS